SKIHSRPEAKEVSQEKYRQSASYAQILAYGKLVLIERGQLVNSELKEGEKVDEAKKKEKIQKQKQVQKRSVKEMQPQPLTKFEGKLIASIDTYNKLFPGNQD